MASNSKNSFLNNCVTVFLEDSWNPDIQNSETSSAVSVQKGTLRSTDMSWRLRRLKGHRAVRVKDFLMTFSLFDIDIFHCHVKSSE